VLDALHRLGWIDEPQLAAARAERLRLASGAGGFTAAPWIAALVRAQLAEHFSTDALQAEGLEIQTTIDTRWQDAAQRALEGGLARLERDIPAVRRQRAARRLEGAAIVLDPSSGAVLALVGGRDYQRSQFNRATQAKRQPGSCFKPFVYAAGFEQALAGEGGLTAASRLEDAPVEVEAGGRIWSPANYDREYRGWVTTRQALEQSLNVPAVRAGTQVGLAAVIDLAHRCGIVSELDPVPALTLGAAEVTPLELAVAYATLANGGQRMAPWVIRSVRDREDRLVGRHRPPDAEGVLDPQIAYLVSDILRGVLDRGTAHAARDLGYGGAAAGKTGTTDDTRDAWFVGYTPRHLALVWVGYDDNHSTGLTGASGALPIWVDLLRRGGAAAGDAFTEPPGMVRELIDPETGELASNGCPIVVEELFARGTEPTVECTTHGAGRLRRWLRRIFGRERDEPPGV
jgi:penicillin-binding protein 1B